MSILSKNYWRSAVLELRSLRKLVLAALFSALAIALDGLYIPVGESLRIMFSFFVVSVGAAIYGPVLALLVGAVSDTVGYFMFPSGAYFPGYLLSAMLGGLIYALFLYRRQITVLRIFGAKFLVNYVVNVLMGSIWSSMLYSKGYLYYAFSSLIKNSILLPFETILMSMLFAALLPTMGRFHLTPVHSEAQLQSLRPGESTLWVFGVDFLLAAAAAIYFGLTTELLLLWIGIGAGAVGLILLVCGGVRHMQCHA